MGVAVGWPVCSTVAPRGTASTSVVAMPRTIPSPVRWTTWTLMARLFASSLTRNSLNKSGKAAGPNVTSTNQLPVQVIAPPLVTSDEAD